MDNNLQRLLINAINEWNGQGNYSYAKDPVTHKDTVTEVDQEQIRDRDLVRVDFENGETGTFIIPSSYVNNYVNDQLKA